MYTTAKPTLLLAFLLYFLSLLGQDHIPGKIDKLAQKAISNQGFPALSIGIYKGGKVYKSHYGALDTEKGHPPTDNTLYEIASVTKTFTGCLLAQAVLDGKLTLVDDIRTYLPKELNSLTYGKEPIQIQHLITHTSGLPFILPTEIQQLYDHPDSQLPFKIATIEKAYSKAGFLKDLETLTLEQKPGSSYSYSDVGAEIIGLILEQVYQQSFERLLTEHLFLKAQMLASKISLSEGEKANLAPGYDGTGQLMPYSQSKLWAAGAGIKTTLPDLIKYVALQLDEELPFIQESHRLLYQDKANSLSYFWNIGESKSGGTYLYHHGGAFGAQNWLLIYPQLDIGITILTNQSAPETSGKLAELANDLFQIVK
ncbi:MAG: serine hydrolase domain-containing protein [Bacteroidota bacterium]